MSWKYTWGEVLELFEEVHKANIQGIISEACDVYTCASCAFWVSTGIDLPLFWTKSAKSWFKRVEVWKQIFAREGLVFKVEYLRYGGNHEKPEKVARALSLAREEQG
jgi:hypothetical protein